MAAIIVGIVVNAHDPNLLYASAAPIFGNWEPHIGFGTPIAVLIAFLVVAKGPELTVHRFALPRNQNRVGRGELGFHRNLEHAGS